MSKLAVSTVIFSCILSPCFGQVVEERPIRADVNVAVGIPQGELGEAIDGEAIGLTAFVGGPVPNSPIVLGSEIGFMNYGTHSRLSVHSTVFDDGIGSELAVPVEAMTTSATNNVLLGHFVVRLQPETGILQPYVDALAGVKYFRSHLNVDSDVVVFRGGLSQDANISDLALSYGIGAGVELELYQHEGAWSDAPVRFALHGGGRYLFGRAAHYAVGAVMPSESGVLVNEVESATNLIVAQFGIRVSH